jgi:iron complex transport system ATP-binding protein
MTAKHAALEPWWHTYEDDDRGRARGLLDRLGVGALADQRFGTLSSGERQRVQLARTLMADPRLLLLDEPTAGLDLGGREDLVARLGHLAADPTTPPVVLVTHHVEEIPAGFGHVLLVTEGRVQAAGPIDEVLTDDALSACFGLPLTVVRRGDRWTAWADGGEAVRP